MQTLAFLSNIGLQEILLLVLIILLLFGYKRIPDLARSLGQSMNEFRKGREEGVTRPPPAQDAPPSDSSKNVPPAK